MLGFEMLIAMRILRTSTALEDYCQRLPWEYAVA